MEIALGDSALSGTESSIADETTDPGLTDTFSAAATEGAAKVISDMAAGEHKAIWIKRIILHNSGAESGASATLKVSGIGSMATYYYDAITALSPDGYWRLDDASGSTATATTGSNGTYGAFSKGQRLSRQLPTLKPGCRLSARDPASNSEAILPRLRQNCYARLPISAATEGDFSVTFLLKPALFRRTTVLFSRIVARRVRDILIRITFCWHIFL